MPRIWWLWPQSTATEHSYSGTVHLGLIPTHPACQHSLQEETRAPKQNPWLSVDFTWVSWVGSENQTHYLRKERMGSGPELLWVCGGSVTPQRKVKIGGPTSQRGPRMLELRNVLNIKEYSKKLRLRKSEKVFLTPHYPLSQNNVWDVLFSSKKRWHPPGKIFAFRKIFLRGGEKGRGPNVWVHPPQPDVPQHAPGWDLQLNAREQDMVW